MDNYTTAQASPGYVGIFAPSGELSVAETAARLNALEEEVQALRLQLASADEHVEALTRGGQVAFAAASILRQLVRNNLIKGEYTHDEARIAVAYFEETAFGPALSAASAWLRR